MLSFFLSCNSDDSSQSVIPETLPDIALTTFTNPTEFTNIYYGPAISGIIYVYEAGEVGEEPDEEIRIERKINPRLVMGVNCVIQNDRVFLDGILIEDTDDWLAQDEDGNIWYFGEEVKNYDDDGNFTDTDGSWEAGVDGALPGYWIPSNPTVGQTYYQEFYLGEAEDEGEVLAIGQTVTTKFGTFDNCLVTRDFTRLEPEVSELKYYAPNIGFIKAEVFENNELIETEELIEIIE